jgi:hypothetical protein
VQQQELQQQELELQQQCHRWLSSGTARLLLMEAAAAQQRDVAEL